MIQEKFKQYAESHNVIIPQSYIDAMVSCDNDSEKICKDYGDINLFSLEEFVYDILSNNPRRQAMLSYEEQIHDNWYIMSCGGIR